MNKMAIDQNNDEIVIELLIFFLLFTEYLVMIFAGRVL